MSYDYITLGPTPSGESCAQVGAEGYESAARAECRRYLAQLERQWPGLRAGAKLGCYLAIKSFSHDFGRYFEVVVRYDTESPEARELAFEVESNLPEFWSEEGQEAQKGESQ